MNCTAAFHSLSRLLLRLLPRSSESFVFQFSIQNLKINVYRNVILPVILYGCETGSLALRDERRLRVFENRVLRKILGRNRDEVTGDWRKLHNEELHDLTSSPSTIRVIKKNGVGGACSACGGVAERNRYGALVRKHEGKRPFGRSKRRWEDNIKMGLRERRWEVVDQIHLA